MIGPPMVPPNCCHFELRNEIAGDGIRLGLVKGVARLIRIGAPEPEAAAVNVIAARLGLRGHDTGDGLAELRIVILQCDLGFGDGVEIRIDDDDAEDGILIVGAVEFEGGAAESAVLA